MYGYTNPRTWHKCGILIPLWKVLTWHCCKSKSTNIVFTRNSLIIVLWELLTWHCCNSSQSAGCRSWVVGMNLHSNSVLHNMWSVVCKVDLKRIRRGWSCDCGCVWCSGACQENDKCIQLIVWSFCYIPVLYFVACENTAAYSCNTQPYCLLIHQISTGNECLTVK